MIIKTFEDYLKDRHTASYCGLDDYTSGTFDNWLENLDKEDLLRYSQEMLDEIEKKLINILK